MLWECCNRVNCVLICCKSELRVHSTGGFIVGFESRSFRIFRFDLKHITGLYTYLCVHGSTNCAYQSFQILSEFCWFLVDHNDNSCMAADTAIRLTPTRRALQRVFLIWGPIAMGFRVVITVPDVGEECESRPTMSDAFSNPRMDRRSTAASSRRSFRPAHRLNLRIQCSPVTGSL